MCSRMPHFIHKLQQVWGFHHQRRKRNFCPDISTSGRQIPDFQDGYRDPNWVTTMHIAVHAIGILGWTMVEWMTLQSTRKQPSIKPASSPRNQHQLLPTSSWNRNWIRMRDEIPISSLRRFFISVRKFYISITSKMLAKFPFDDPVVCGLALLNPKNRGDLPPSAITDIARRFPNLVAEEDFTNLEEEFLDYQTTPASEFPSCDSVRTDEFWGSILHLSNRITQKSRFPLMKKVISAVLTIPNSNADCERVFSIVKKIQTDMRSNLDNSTLCALLTSKLNQTEKCHSFKPTKEQLKCAKSACVCYNSGLWLW